MTPNLTTLTTINQTNTNDTYTPPYKLWEATLIGLFLSIIILVSIGGNVLVCVAILTDRKLRGTVSNLFLMSLAISDLVVSSIVMPIAVANDILQFWVFPMEFCNIWISFDVLSATASILNLCAISLDRYIHMKNPFRYNEWMTRRKCLFIIGIIWLVSSLISFLPISLKLHEIKPTANPLTSPTSNAILVISNTLSAHTNSTPSYNNVTLGSTPLSLVTKNSQCNLELNRIYATVSSTFSFIIPCIIMVTIYSLIYKLARHHADSIRRTQAGPRNQRTSIIQENKALFTLGMIMGLFLLCWIPFFIANLTNAYCECVHPMLFTAFIWLGYINSTMNPIIYSKFNADFRAAFKKILCCDKCRTSDPYDRKSNRKHSNTSRSSKSNGVNGISNGNHQTNGSYLPRLSNDINEKSELIEMSERVVLSSNLSKEDVNDNFI